MNKHREVFEIKIEIQWGQPAFSYIGLSKPLF